MNELVEELQRIRARFPSDEAMAARLRQLDPTSFGPVDRTTVWRWCNDCITLPRRAQLAVTLLGDSEEHSVRVVLSTAVVNLPLALACLPRKRGGQQSPLQQGGIKPSIQITTTGAEALQLLIDDKADLAVAGTGLLRSRNPVFRLCRIGSHQLTGISTVRPIKLAAQFANLEFACPADTSIVSILRPLLKSRGCRHELVGVPSPQEGRNWLLAPSPTVSGRCLVAFHEWFERADPAISADAPEMFEVDDNLFEERETFDLYFNNRRVRPGAIRIFLECLRGICDDPNGFFQNANFDAELANHLEDARQMLRSFSHPGDAITTDKVELKVSELDAESILALWDQEVSFFVGRAKPEGNEP